MKAEEKLQQINNSKQKVVMSVDDLIWINAFVDVSQEGLNEAIEDLMQESPANISEREIKRWAKVQASIESLAQAKEILSKTVVVEE